MKIINDLSFVCGVNKKWSHAIFEKDNSYYINFCHGTEYGRLFLELNGFVIEVFPKEIRQKILIYSGFYIPNNIKLFINPCFPKQVKNKFLNDLKKNNIFLFSGNWDQETWSYISDEEKMLDYFHECLNRNKKYTLWVDSESNISKIQKNIWNKTKFEQLNYLKNTFHYS
jgi:hypothetical protein